MTVKRCATIHYEGFQYTVEGEYEPYIPARINGPPEDCYEVEGGYFETFQVFDMNGIDVTDMFNEEQLEDIHELAYQDLRNGGEA